MLISPFRRLLLAALASGMLVLPILAAAQQPTRVWRIGFLFTTPKPETRNANYLSFLEGMRSAGYVEGVNLEMEDRYADDNYERLPALASELVKARVDVIVAMTGPAVQAAQQATRTLPIVMVATSDPVGRKIIASLARPGANVTGPASMGFDLVDKHLELVRVALPKAKRIAVMTNPDNADAPRVQKLVVAAAARLGVSIIQVSARSPSAIEQAFGSLLKARAEALILAPDGLFTGQVKQIAQLAIKNKVPTVYWARPGVMGGGLISYGPNLVDEFRRAAGYVDRILKGGNPAEMPSEQPNKLEFLINKKTAAAIGLTIPPELLLRADRVIE